MWFSTEPTTHASRLFCDLSSEAVTSLDSACHREDWHVATFLSGEGMLLLTSGARPVEVIQGSPSLSEWKPSPESAICWLHTHGVAYQLASSISQNFNPLLKADLRVIFFLNDDAVTVILKLIFNIWCYSVRSRVQQHTRFVKSMRQ